MLRVVGVILGKKPPHWCASTVIQDCQFFLKSAGDIAMPLLLEQQILLHMIWLVLHWKKYGRDLALPKLPLVYLKSYFG